MTADEYLSTEVFGTDFDDLERALQNFAKLKCQELLLIVAKKARIDFRNNKANDFGIDVDSILNCVDLDSFIEGTSSS